MQTISFTLNITFIRVVSCIIFSLFLSTTKAQDISVKLGPDQIAANEFFTISVTVENERIRGSINFPDIQGLAKRGTSSSTNTSFINGRMSSSQSIIQNYQASGEGTIKIPDFEIEVNGEKIFVRGKTLTVGPPKQRSTQRSDPFDPFEDFFNRRQEPTEYMEVEADAFLSLNTDKNEVYVGEGFTTTLAFYVSESNRADMRFYDLGSQLTKIVKDIKPDNCWEENFNIDNIVGESVQIRGKAYTQYKIYQATFYPLNDEDINFPGVDLKMIKYRVAKNPTYFGRNRQEDYEDFRSKSRTVTVKELPPHPLKDRLAVGNYRLKEKISSDELKTSQSFNYSFTITGEGNISSIEAPIINDR